MRRNCTKMGFIRLTLFSFTWIDLCFSINVNSIFAVSCFSHVSMGIRRSTGMMRAIWGHPVKSSIWKIYKIKWSISQMMQSRRKAMITASMRRAIKFRLMSFKSTLKMRILISIPRYSQKSKYLSSLNLSNFKVNCKRLSKSSIW